MPGRVAARDRRRRRRSARCALGRRRAAGASRAASRSARAYALADGLVLARPAARRRCAGLSRPGGAVSGARCACSAPPPTCSASSRPARATRGPGCDHGAWPADGFRCTSEPTPASAGKAKAVDYPFVRVDGDGVHEIPVGPVHAGIIEPGHFRFSVVGEKVLRLEERLGYTHKGIEKRFTSWRSLEGASPRRRASRAIRRSPMRGPTAMALEALLRLRRSRRAPSGCARCCSSASASPITSATSVRSATTPACLRPGRSSRACAEDWLRAVEGGLRPPLLMDCDRAGRHRRATCRRRGGGADRRAQCDAIDAPRCSDAADRSTTSTPACRIASSAPGT